MTRSISCSGNAPTAFFLLRTWNSRRSGVLAPMKSRHRATSRIAVMLPSLINSRVEGMCSNLGTESAASPGRSTST